MLPARLYVLSAPFKRSASFLIPLLCGSESSGSLGYQFNEIKFSIMFGSILGDTNKEL